MGILKKALAKDIRLVLSERIYRGERRGFYIKQEELLDDGWEKTSETGPIKYRNDASKRLDAMILELQTRNVTFTEVIVVR